MMSDMMTYSLTLRAQLDQIATETTALAVAKLWGNQDGRTLALTSMHRDAPRLGVTAAVQADDPVAAISDGCTALAAAAAEHGLTVTGWDAIELLTQDEVRTRLERPAIPPLVSAAELAALCGVAKQRIYELDGERKKAEARGERHAFPAPVVPGYWLKSVAETYAANRKRKPGPTPKSA